MPRHIVCLTYDFDALSLPIAKGTVSPTALSRGEFGLVGVERIHLLRLLLPIKRGPCRHGRCRRLPLANQCA